MKKSMRFLQHKELINDEVALLFANLVKKLPGLARIAVALYEKESGVLHTFLRSPENEKLLNHYTVALKEVESLNALAGSGEQRVIDDISELDASSLHTKELIKNNIKSSFTIPIYLGKDLLGFVFFDSKRKHYFSEDIVQTLSVYAQLIEAMLVMDILPVRALMGMLTSSRRLTALKDYETGLHVVRVSAYVEIIATALAEELGFSDEVIEYMWLYAPLHDIGKIGIPDKVLLKPDRLDEAEMQVMQTHVSQGAEIIEQIIDDFSFQGLHHLDILKNMIAMHHERWDGQGYPQGLVAEEIALEARILAVADVFDAMSSMRVYRDAYKLDEVFRYIESHRGKRFDPMCVDAFLKQKEKVIAASKRFSERQV